ncbi:MAG: hypothetical protein ACRDTF_21915, partial [Pseudonocardiaceae bacterium]
MRSGSDWPAIPWTGRSWGSPATSHSRTPGALSRSPVWWDHQFLDREHRRRGGTALFHLVHPDGWAAYRIEGVRSPTGSPLIDHRNTAPSSDPERCRTLSDSG